MFHGLLPGITMACSGLMDQHRVQWEASGMHNWSQIDLMACKMLDELKLATKEMHLSIGLFQVVISRFDKHY